MRYSGVLFDLYGTLVAPFRMREHMAVVRECADILGIGFEEFHDLMGETLQQRLRGEFGSMAANFDLIATRLGVRTTELALAKAQRAYTPFIAEGLTPVSGALELLDRLASHGVRLGLVSNCAPDVPEVWDDSPLSRHFDHCTFSCEVGIAKPDPGIYRHALDALGLEPSETLYVGDGSDDELAGAERCGMEAVLVTVDLSNTYDAQRTDVQRWAGPTIGSLSELPRLLEHTEAV